MNNPWIRSLLLLGILLAFTADSHAQILGGRLRPRGEAQQDEADDAPRRPRLRGVVERLTDAVENGDINVAPGADAGEGGGLLGGLLPILNGAGQNAEPLDAARLNEAFAEELAAPLVEEIEPLERLELRIDEQHTDFAHDRLGIHGAMRLRNTPWHCPADLSLHVHASVDVVGGHGPRALVTADVDLLTDTVAMFNSARQMAMKRLRSRSASSSESAEILALLESTPPFRTLGDVADFLPRMGEINLRNANHKILALQSQIIHAVDPAEEKHLIDELARAYRDRDNLLAFSIRSRRNAVLDVEQIEVTLPGGGVSYQMADVESVHLVITPGGLSGSVTVAFGKAGVVMYRGAKAVIVEPALRKIQQRDPATLESLRQRGRQFSEELNLSPRAPSGAEELPLPVPQ